ncbi:MAG: hypothetical protein ACLPYS_01740 [Vulcanimicrobiaceae bacterium]|jgi:hypothetical protein
MIATGNILEDDLILEVARRLKIGFGSEVSELILDLPQVLAKKASRALQLHIAYIGSNDFGEEIFRVGPQREASGHFRPEIEGSPVLGVDAKAANVSGSGPFNPFGAFRRLFA